MVLFVWLLFSFRLTTDLIRPNLAKTDLACDLGALLQKFELRTRNGGRTIVSKWTCATLTQQQNSGFSTSLPRNLAPVTRELWNLERYESGSLGQRCPGGSVMTQFLALPAPVDMQLGELKFTYTCMSPGLDAAGVYGLGSQGCTTHVSTNDGRTGYYTPGCSRTDRDSEGAIGSWKVVTTGTQPYIEYTCCAINQPSGRVVTETEALSNLHGVSYSCSPGEGLQSFELEQEPGSNSVKRLKYTCVTINTARRLPDVVSSNQGGRLQWDPFQSSWMLEPSEVIQIIQPVKVETGFEWYSECPPQFIVEGWRFERFGAEQVSLLLTCRKVAQATCDSEFAEQTDQKLECTQLGSKAMGSLQFSSKDYQNSVREVFDIKTHCCKVPLEPSETVCETRQTGTRNYDGRLDLDADSIWAELDMAVDCQGKALTSFNFKWPDSLAAGWEVTIEYRCCSLEPYREQLAGLHSAASRPQDVVAKVADTEAEQERGRAEGHNVYNVVVEVHFGFKPVGLLHSQLA